MANFELYPLTVYGGVFDPYFHIILVPPSAARALLCRQRLRYRY